MKLSPDQKAGLLITAIVHLAVIIVFLAVQIGYQVKKENSFVLDFTQQEEKEKAEKKAALQQSALEKLEEMIAAARDGAPVRSIAVDRSTLKDDRGTDADKLYEEAERLAKELKDGQTRPADDPEEVAVSRPTKEEKKPVKAYTGPTVLSWSLEGRRASRLPIPAYKCIGAGQVMVQIVVNNQGNVIDARIDPASSSADRCLQSYALQAARLSRFSVSQTAPPRQSGNIIYAFIAQ